MYETDKQSLCSANLKHYPPSLSDEIWRLKTVGKDGAFHQRLASHKITTVEDLLRKYVINPSELRKVRDFSVFGL